MLYIMDRSWCVMTYNLHPVKSMDIHYDMKIIFDIHWISHIHNHDD